MPTPVQVPKATITMEEATLLSWLKSEGDAIKKDEVLFELETDKAVMEVPSPADGVLIKVLTPSGVVRVDQIVGWVGGAGESIEAAAVPSAPSAMERPATVAIQTAGDAAPDRVAATPAARRRARELGVDLKRVTGSGLNGRITEEDVEKAASSVSTPHQPLARNKVLVSRLSEAWREAPHIHIARKMNVAGLERARTAHAGVSVTDMLLYSLARVLPEFPALTAVWREELLWPADEIGLSFAVDTPRGVVAPVVRNVAAYSIAKLAAERKRLAEAAKNGRLSPECLEGGVFTLTNLGMLGVDFFAPVLNYPQTAILAVGRINQEPVVEDGQVRVGFRMWANLALDHRASDGADAGRFLAALERHWNESVPE